MTQATDLCGKTKKDNQMTSLNHKSDVPPIGRLTLYCI